MRSPACPAKRPTRRKLLLWWRDHWKIENQLHYVRDVTLGRRREPDSHGNAPENLASVRNAAIGLLRILSHTNIAAALRETPSKSPNS